MTRESATVITGVPVSSSGTRREPTARPRILVIDPDRVTARTFQLTLRRRGFDVKVAHDGLQALHAMGRQRPDLVVMDLRLPLVAGVDVLRELRIGDAGMTTPVVVYTAEDPETVRRITRDCPPDALVRKPAPARHIITRIEALLAAADRGPGRFDG
ncbi:MAG: response regulator [Planctomycetota bacterium]